MYLLETFVDPWLSSPARSYHRGPPLGAALRRSAIRHSHVLRRDYLGVSREDIEVRIDDGFLVVRGERVAEDEADFGRI